MNRTVVGMLAALAVPLAASAADLPPALAGRRLSLSNADGVSMGVVELGADGTARMTRPNGKTTAGKWQVADDRICAQFPPRKQACWGSAKELEANGHATMTNLAGEHIKVVKQ